MKNTTNCPRCSEEQDAEKTYCDSCGINMHKISCEYDKEKIIKEEKPKKGSFEKSFFRGKQRSIKR